MRTLELTWTWGHNYSIVSLYSEFKILIYRVSATLYQSLIIFTFFVTGFTMYKTLTRNAFRKVQSKMFPLYFMTGVITSSVALLTHLYIKPVGTWMEDTVSFYQVSERKNFFFYRSLSTAVLWSVKKDIQTANIAIRILRYIRIAILAVCISFLTDIINLQLGNWMANCNCMSHVRTSTHCSLRYDIWVLVAQ